MPERMVGTVVGIKPERGYFFISGSDDRDYFALASDLPDHRSIRSIIPHVTQIEFTPEARPKGPAAVDLRILNEDEVAEAVGNRA